MSERRPLWSRPPTDGAGLCPACGHAISSDDRFCPACGHAFAGREPTVRLRPQSPPPAAQPPSRPPQASTSSTPAQPPPVSYPPVSGMRPPAAHVGGSGPPQRGRGSTNWLWAGGVIGALVVVAVIVLTTSKSGSGSTLPGATVPNTTVPSSTLPSTETAPSVSLSDSATCSDWGQAGSVDQQAYSQQYGGDGGTVNGTDVFTYLNAICTTSSSYDYSQSTLGDLMSYLATNGYSSAPCDSSPTSSLPSC